MINELQLSAKLMNRPQKTRVNEITIKKILEHVLSLRIEDIINLDYPLARIM